MVRREKILVSACLIGVKCRYDGNHALSAELSDKVGGAEIIPVCPEQLGGLSTPRPAAEIEGGDGHDVLDGNAKVVLVRDGRNVTPQFIAGAQATLLIAKHTGARKAIMKARSPSCGCGTIKVRGEELEGDGVTVALLKRNGIEVEAVE